MNPQRWCVVSKLKAKYNRCRDYDVKTPFQKARFFDLRKRYDVQPPTFDRRSSAGPAATQADDARESGYSVYSSSMQVANAVPVFVSTPAVPAMTGANAHFTNESGMEP